MSRPIGLALKISVVKVSLACAAKLIARSLVLWNQYFPVFWLVIQELCNSGACPSVVPGLSSVSLCVRTFNLFGTWIIRVERVRGTGGCYRRVGVAPLRRAAGTCTGSRSSRNCRTDQRGRLTRKLLQEPTNLLDDETVFICGEKFKSNRGDCSRPRSPLDRAIRCCPRREATISKTVSIPQKLYAMCALHICKHNGT